MTEKRFTMNEDGYIWDNKEPISQETVLNRLNALYEDNEELKSENDTYKDMFFQIVETALTDKNCRELYCEGLLDIFDKANSLNQARKMIKEHLK